MAEKRRPPYAEEIEEAIVEQMGDIDKPFHWHHQPGIGYSIIS